MTAAQTFFTVDQIADALQVNARTVRRWIEKKFLIAYRIAGVLRIGEGDFQAFLAAHRDD
jgi:excisionase family DNA binding protein